MLAGWVLALAVCWAAAPPWNDVAQDREFAFLPAEVQSRKAEDIYAKAFPDDQLASNVVLVLHRASSEGTQLDKDLKFIEETLEPGLRQIAASEGGLASEAAPPDEPLFGSPAPTAPASTTPTQRPTIARIRTPNDPEAGALLVSPDDKALVVEVELTTEMLSKDTWPTIDKIEKLVADLKQSGKVPAGLDITLTGSALVGRDHIEGELQSARATEILTIVLVVTLLLVIYRAPLIALIPLVTVFLVVQLSLHALAILGKAGYINLFEGIQIYVTILTYGAGVDYCIFFIARYREELEAGTAPADAVRKAIEGVGAPVAASAGTVIIGIGMMVFAQFGKFHEAGYAVPFSILLVFFASLTFSPALLRLAGHWAFWPRHVEKLELAKNGKPVSGDRRRWLRRFGDLSTMWDALGDLVLRRPGMLWLGSMALMIPFMIVGIVFERHLSYDLIADLPPHATSVAGTQLLEKHFPSGILGPMTVVLVDPETDFGSDTGRAEVEHLTNQLREHKDILGLADIRTLTAPLGITSASTREIRELKIPQEARNAGARRAALQRYVSDLGERKKTGTRLELILNRSPFSQESLQNLPEIQRAIVAALPEEARDRTQIYVSGTTSSIADLETVMKGDRVRIQVLVLVAVFLILIVLLREFVVPLYLLLSVLFSYFVTLGATYLVFWALDPSGFVGLDWKVAIFLFTILIAVGEDYNIFLITRVHEEQRRFGMLNGIIHALVRTGPIISNCGIIMAGTFASLVAGSLQEMKELGFALCFGVILDTFVVRPIIVPAFLVLRQNGKLSVVGWNPQGKLKPAPQPPMPAARLQAK
jgi:RND superfamily putative drug exporter